MGQELLTLPEHFLLFRLAIVLSVLLRLTYSDYPFGIFKLFSYICKSKGTPFWQAFQFESFYIFNSNPSLYLATDVSDGSSLPENLSLPPPPPHTHTH